MVLKARKNIEPVVSRSRGRHTHCDLFIVYTPVAILIESNEILFNCLECSLELRPQLAVVGAKFLQFRVLAREGVAGHLAEDQVDEVHEVGKLETILHLVYVRDSVFAY